MNVYTLSEALQLLQTKKPSVIWIKSKEYSTIVMQNLYRLFSMQYTIQHLSLDCDDIAYIKTQSAIPFLGVTFFYALGNVSKLPKHKTSFLSYLQSYMGPHTFILWSDGFTSIKECPKSWCVIELPETISRQSSDNLIQELFPEKQKPLRALLEYMWITTFDITLENLCILAMYADFVGSNYKFFVDAYRPLFIKQEMSLFSLSQYFFKRDQRAFYTQWSSMASLYSIPFWISFWTDQLWRATLFIQEMNNNNRNEAYEIGKYKLPFSFTKSDWSRLSGTTIQEYHAMLCDIDFMLKNGSNHNTWIELFYHKWFNDPLL